MVNECRIGDERMQAKRWTNAGEAMNLSYCDMFEWRNTDHGRTELALSCHAIYVRFCDMLVFIGREISWYSKRRTGSVESWNRDNPECRCFVFFHRRFWMSSLFTLFFFLLRAPVRFSLFFLVKKVLFRQAFFLSRPDLWGDPRPFIWALSLSLKTSCGHSPNRSVAISLSFPLPPLFPFSSSSTLLFLFLRKFEGRTSLFFIVAWG